jgi:hypothetical protein
MCEKDQDIVGRILQTGAGLVQLPSSFRRHVAKLITIANVL